MIDKPSSDSLLKYTKLRNEPQPFYSCEDFRSIVGSYQQFFKSVTRVKGKKIIHIFKRKILEGGMRY